MNHIMINMATMGLKPHSKIVSIGAIRFDPTKNKIYKNEKLHMCFNLDDQIFRSEDDNIMVDYWDKQPVIAKAQLNGKEMLEDGLLILYEFINDLSDCRIWSKHIDFDIPILNNAYFESGMTLPYEFYNTRDVKTLKEIKDLKINAFNEPESVTNSSTLRNAFLQAKFVCKYFYEIYK